jgi:ABC-type bacteriocin/lantibiotic exporter with double-glycine peptidase domain
VSFAYSPVTPLVIGDFSLRLGRGVRAALVGPSGSGKSTLGQLMVGLRQATAGEVRIFGRRIEDWPRNLLSREIAYVDQNVCLFEGAIKDNITLWDETMPEENYVRAAQDAMIHHVITSRPGGYHARLLEGGRNLSGGERQRLALARAFAANPRILVLDEATSALDPVLEKAVMDSVRRRGASCILIAHRISTIRDCDVILVLDGGRVVEHGTHQELMAAGGLYRELVEH